jgi:cell division protein FtsQ
MKKLITVLVFILLATGVLFLFVFANLKQDEVVCERFDININYNGAQQLITSTSIRQQLTREGIKIKGQLVSSIDIEQIQKLLNANAYVRKATVTVDVNGIVTANLVQREPVLRIIDKNDYHYLIDREGIMMPVSFFMPVRVMVANGNINLRSGEQSRGSNNIKGANQSVISDLLKTTLALNSDSLTSAMIEQIYVNYRGELELVPKIGHQSILLGDTVDLAAKLNKLKLFYTQEMKNQAWSKYKVINLKYQDQVVCIK